MRKAKASSKCGSGWRVMSVVLPVKAELMGMQNSVEVCNNDSILSLRVKDNLQPKVVLRWCEMPFA